MRKEGRGVFGHVDGIWKRKLTIWEHIELRMCLDTELHTPVRLNDILMKFTINSNYAHMYALYRVSGDM